MRNVAKCLGYLLGSFKTGISWFLKKDPPFYEVVKNYEEYHESTHITLNTNIRLALIEDWIEPYSTILEVGCGEGFNMLYLKERRYVEAVGVDISEKAVEKVLRLGLKAYVMDVDQQSLSALGQNFDYVLFIETIEHLKYPQKALMEAAKIARKGVIVSLPNSGWIGWRMQMLRGYFPRQSFTHLHFFTIRDFELFLKMLGLKPLDMKTELDYHGINIFPCNKLKNIIAYQQVWLIAPLKSNHQ
jgi:methionine biosynthesis protein MetW